MCHVHAMFETLLKRVSAVVTALLSAKKWIRQIFAMHFIKVFILLAPGQ